MPRSITLSLKIALVTFLFALIFNLSNTNKSINPPQSDIKPGTSG